MRKLDIDKVRAIVAWQRHHGRFWKTNLRNAWMTGRYGGVDSETQAVLQALRNTDADWLNQQVAMGDLKAQLHHHDLRVAAQCLIDKLNAGHGHVYTSERVRLEGLLQIYPEAYDGAV